MTYSGVEEESPAVRKGQAAAEDLPEADQSKSAVFNHHSPTDDADTGELRIRVDGKWLHLSKEFVANHPGGSVITQYRDADATHIFHAFHEGSTMAYKQLALLMRDGGSITPVPDDPFPPRSQRRNGVVHGGDYLSINLGTYDFTAEKEMRMVRSFEDLRQEVHQLGLMDEQPLFYARKIAEAAMMFIAVLGLQFYGWYQASAVLLALCWQQLGWLTHEFCHVRTTGGLVRQAKWVHRGILQLQHQPFKNRRLNDWFSLLLGNIAQGYSRDWWKDKHNTHHAATNIVDQDGDIDLAPLIAMVPHDLLKYKEPLERALLRLIPYQHFYFTFALPTLRFSWTSQSISHVLNASQSRYRKHRRLANWERFGIAVHWLWVLLQLYALPSNSIRLAYFLISQLGGGFLVALVVTYNHNSCLKFAEHSPILNNFAALHLLTTRNMRPSALTDWFWGGLNYQIEHHLFPTMPRPNLNECSKLVKKFCAENGLPYLVDGYWDGYEEILKLLRNVSRLALPLLGSK